MSAQKPETDRPVAVRATALEHFGGDEDKWAAVVHRDVRADDVFYYSVRTTGVYCRPSCAARLAAPRERSIPSLDD